MPARRAPDGPWHVPVRAPLRPPALDDEDDDPWSWAPLDDPPSTPPHGGAARGLSSVGPRGGQEMDAEETGSGHPDLTPDPLVEPLIARVALPPRPLRPTLISRLRDQVALRLALMRGTDADEFVDTARGGPQPVESVGPVVAAMRARMGPPGTERHPGWTGAPPAEDPDLAGAASWPEVPFHPTSAEELPRTPASSRVLELDRGPRTPGRHARRLGDRRGALGTGDGPAAAGPGRLAGLPDQLRRLTDRPRLAWIAVAALAVVVILVSFLVSHAGAPTPAGLASSGLTSPAAASRAPVAHPAITAEPSASTAPTANPTATPAPTPVAAAQTYGAGGTGWALQDVRCCSVEAGTGYTRIVFDLGGASGSNPTASVSFPTPTTMVVAFPSVSAPGSLTASGGGGLVASVSRASGSELTFRLTLSRGATVQDYGYLPNADEESSAPLHLYLDLG